MLVGTLNDLYKTHPALHVLACDARGFECVHCDDRDNSVLAFYRYADDTSPAALCVFNFTPVPRNDYRLGVASSTRWTKVFDSDAVEFSGTGYSDQTTAHADAIPIHGRSRSLAITLPPLAAVVFVAEQ